MNSSVFSQFTSACDLVAMPPAGATVVVAVSGGADSMALWDLLVRAERWSLVIFHLNHGLRPEAHGDAELIQQRALYYSDQKLKAGTLVCEQSNISALAARWHCSSETAGRRHRYARLADIAHRHEATAVLTAHHLDDQIETVLANLLRGAGPVGLSGIPRRRPLTPTCVVLRPLLAIPREQLRDYLLQRALDWREDSTNTDTRFTRNFLRHQVIPGLECGVPGIGEALADLAERNRNQIDLDEDLVLAAWKRSLGEEDLMVDGIAAMPERLRLLLWRRLLMHLALPMARRHLRRLDDLARGSQGRRMTLGKWLFTRRDLVIIWESSTLHELLPVVEIPGPGEYHHGREHLLVWTDTPPADPRVLPGEANLDLATCRFPLVWRLPYTGERWVAFGAPGSQTVSRWLANRGVEMRERHATTVLADIDGVVWIPGHTIAERCRVQEHTSAVLRLVRSRT